MGKRRSARTHAAQFLYGYDIRKNVDELDRDLAEFWQMTEKGDEPIRRFAEELVKGVVSHREELDKIIRSYAEKWSLERMSVVDRNILRLGLYEMNFREDIPPVAALNEAIEVAKVLGGEESSRFVNGILNRAMQDLKKTLR